MFNLGTNEPDGIAPGRILIDDVVIVPCNGELGKGISELPGFKSVVEVTSADYVVTVIDSNGCSSDAVFSVSCTN